MREKKNEKRLCYLARGKSACPFLLCPPGAGIPCIMLGAGKLNPLQKPFEYAGGLAYTISLS